MKRLKTRDLNSKGFNFRVLNFDLESFDRTLSMGPSVLQTQWCLRVQVLESFKLRNVSQLGVYTLVSLTKK